MSRHRAFQRVTKRTIDLTLGALLLALLLPVILAAAILIVLLDRQFPFYSDFRAGRGGTPFRCYKLRSMRSDPRLLVDYLAANLQEVERFRLTSKVLHDPRKTKVGMLLRRTSIDETPQLLHVLLGQMSVVGPRPVPMAEFQARYPRSLEAVAVRPGLTGLWQVKGRSELSTGDRARYDGQYARDWTIRLDLWIILRTPWTVLSGRGAF